MDAYCGARGLLDRCVDTGLASKGKPAQLAQAFRGNGITRKRPERGDGVPTNRPLAVPLMKPLLGLLAVASSMAAVLTSGTPAAAQYYSSYGSRPSYSFTPSQSNTRYNVYQPQRSYSSGYGSSFGQSRRSTQGFGHSSGSYFGW
jgi:hypothetical protein